jgi:uncharacterized protein HemX
VFAANEKAVKQDIKKPEDARRELNQKLDNLNRVQNAIQEIATQDSVDFAEIDFSTKEAAEKITTI